MEKVLKPLTDEERLMGKTEPDTYTVTELNAFTDKVLYNVTNIELGNKPTLFYGNFVGSFLDDEAKKQLEMGAKTVISKGYKIEVYEPKNNATIEVAKVIKKKVKKNG